MNDACLPSRCGLACGRCRRHRREATGLTRDAPCTRTTRDYLADRPLPEATFERSLFVQHELERIAAGKSMQPIDESRFVCARIGHCTRGRATGRWNTV